MHIVCFFFVTPHYCCPLHIVGLPHVVRLPASELASIFPYPFYRRPIQSLGLHEVYMRIFDPACAIGTWSNAVSKIVKQVNLSPGRVGARYPNPAWRRLGCHDMEGVCSRRWTGG